MHTHHALEVRPCWEKWGTKPEMFVVRIACVDGIMKRGGACSVVRAVKKLHCGVCAGTDHDTAAGSPAEAYTRRCATLTDPHTQVPSLRCCRPFGLKTYYLTLGPADSLSHTKPLMDGQTLPARCPQRQQGGTLGR